MILLNIAKTVTLVWYLWWFQRPDMVILVIQVNLVIGEYNITWDSGESCDPGEFGNSL